MGYATAFAKILGTPLYNRDNDENDPIFVTQSTALLRLITTRLDTLAVGSVNRK
jgi:hypothetical protein